MSSKWLLLASVLLLAPSSVKPQLNTIRNVLCAVNRGLFAVNGCIRNEKFTCRIQNMKFKFFCNAFPCTLYSAPAERSCTKILFECPLFDFLPHGICPGLSICCQSGGVSEKKETVTKKPSWLTSLLTPNKQSAKTEQPAKPKRQSEAIPLQWLIALGLNATRPRTKAQKEPAAKIEPSDKRNKAASQLYQTAVRGGATLLDAVSDIGNSLVSNTNKQVENAGNIFKDTMKNLGQVMRLLSKDRAIDPKKVLVDTATNVGKTSNDIVQNAGKALADTVTNVGKTLSSNDLVKNAGKTIADTVSNVGKSLTSNDLVKNAGKTFVDTVTNVAKTLPSDEDVLNAGKAIVEKLASNDLSKNARKLLQDTLSRMGKGLTQKRVKRSLWDDSTSLDMSLEDSFDLEDIFAPEELSLDAESFFGDWAKDETDLAQVESALEGEYERLMDEIDAVNEEEARDGVAAITKISFEEFRNEVMGKED